jgi:hypothetical protein
MNQLFEIYKNKSGKVSDKWMHYFFAYNKKIKTYKTNNPELFDENELNISKICENSSFMECKAKLLNIVI